jgi:hypothetical protein
MMHALMLLSLVLLACTGTADKGTEPTGDTSSSSSTCEDPCETPSTASVERSLSPNAALTRDNPLKGFMTSYLWGEPASDFPDQMEFLYLPMADLWDEKGETLETGLEPHLVAAAERRHHAVIRIYIDYPASEIGLPGYLSELVDCEPYEDHGGGCSPDYDDPDLLEAMLGLISAMGERYDADPRLGFVQVGLLGFWGEWHTYPYTEWFPSEETQDAVLGAFDAAFQTTQLQVRTPAASSMERRIGFHDDSFAYSTIGDVDWFFLPGLETAGAQDRWQEVSIGGELRPELQSEVFSEDYETGTYAQDIGECIEATHASYLLNYYAFNGDGVGYQDDERERAEEAALAMGYQFEIESLTLSATGLLEGTVEASIFVELSQTGVAPFYYPLYLSADSDGLDTIVTGTEDLQTLLPGETRTFTVDFGRVSVDVIHQFLTLRLTSPMLQSGQSIAFASQSLWTADTGEITLSWEIGCKTGSANFAFAGEIVSTNPEGCDCVCDLDGHYRACGAEDCR